MRIRYYIQTKQSYVQRKINTKQNLKCIQKNILVTIHEKIKLLKLPILEDKRIIFIEDRSY